MNTYYIYVHLHPEINLPLSSTRDKNATRNSGRPYLERSPRGVIPQDAVSSEVAARLPRPPQRPNYFPSFLSLSLYLPTSALPSYSYLYTYPVVSDDRVERRGDGKTSAYRVTNNSHTFRRHGNHPGYRIYKHEPRPE